GGVAALAEDPVVDRERNAAETGELFRVRHRLQGASSVAELLLAGLFARAGEPPGRAFRARQVRGHVLDAVEIEVPGFEHVSLVLFFRSLLPADRAGPGGKICAQANNSAQ